MSKNSSKANMECLQSWLKQLERENKEGKKVKIKLKK